jgi:uncharacterized protein YndB with AHSA1/START domain
MEYGSIESEIYVDASPDIVFEVISRPEHLREWWPDEADIEPEPGASGHIVFRNAPPNGDKVERLTVVEADRPRLFSFRWAYDEGVVPGVDNSYFVTFELEPSGEGTRVRMTETGFRERGWEAAVLEAAYNDHVAGWNHFIPRLGVYVTRLVAS